MNSATGSRFQGRDTIVVDAPVDLVWRLIDNSYEVVELSESYAEKMARSYGQPGDVTETSG